MILFINKRFISTSELSLEYSVIKDKSISITEYLGIIKESEKLAFDGITEVFKITNKGGNRLINFIKNLDNSMAEEICLFYDPVTIKYLTSTQPQKLSNYSDYGNNPLIDILSEENLLLSKYENGKIIPMKFSNDELLFEWILKEKPDQCLRILKQLKNIKKTNDLTLPTLLRTLDTTEDLENSCGLGKVDVIKSFISYVV